MKSLKDARASVCNSTTRALGIGLACTLALACMTPAQADSAEINQRATKATAQDVLRNRVADIQQMIDTAVSTNQLTEGQATSFKT